ncbi:hypothetical protein WUBG_07335 [Wuchereria bancrofti]|uniref:Protein argonaute N-terminal domain-containing protein n=1 Tax=Wuchereria bancrofti TaxID=6293 RepID=J9EX51_WUCBA|nr:hypothetical protein WUBG_07335 [Wuchereria bancrofti]
MKGRGRGRRKESLPESEATASTTVGKGYGRGKKQEFTTFSGESAKVGQKHGEQHERIKELAHRPNHGKLGEPIQLTANFKLLQVPPSLQIYCYHVDVLKITKNGRLVVENRDVCREIFWKVISNNEKIFGTGYSLVYDDCHTVYSLKKLKTEKPTLELQLYS